MSIKIVVDSTSDISNEIIKKYDIEVVPLTVNFENESFLDKIEISNADFFEKLQACDKLPTTSQVSPGAFIKVFENILESHDEIIGIFLSSKFSGTCESAKIAKNMIGSDKIHIIDSGTASLGTCLLVEEAHKMLQQKHTCKEIVNRIEEIKNKVIIVAGVGTLKYLEKGGRMSKGTATIGTILNIKPIIKVKDGVIKAIAKVRGKNKVKAWINEWIDENANIENKTITIYHSTDYETCKELTEMVKNKYKPAKIITGDIGSVIGTHTGPNCLAIAYFED
ncbi:DegV family protein [Sedimentibacter sp. zth1]|uniref:DegV family protein n=1 Tax=Sedimentibacter sp. zth1 TaxID=2816908 RepID=UPI001A90FE96|nr:DegV family protein [Sedimentibacter sp. zth1]QSX05575.1 DegV family protein [Sedimentibacter sp. zth1]